MTETERADRAEAALGTLQTALRHQILRWRHCVQLRNPQRTATYVLGYEAGMQTCIDDLNALLPALDGIPHE